VSRSFSLVVNPNAGGGRGSEAVLPVARLLREAGAEVKVDYSPSRATVDGLVAEAVGRGDVVVAVGGDGMVSAMCSAISRTDSEFALIPAGRGNDMARMLNLPTDPSAQADLLLHGEVRPIDLIDVGWRVVASSVYCGVDATAADMVNRMKVVPTGAQYQVAAVRALAGFHPVKMHVTIDGEKHTFDAATIVVANSAYYGNGMKIAPNAIVDDGLLEIVAIEAATRRKLITSMPKVYDGSHIKLPEVHLFQGRSIQIQRAEGSREVLVGADGEPLPPLPGPDQEPLAIEILPAALKIIR